MLTAFFVSSEIKFRTSPSGSEVGRVGKALLRLMLAAVDGLSDNCHVSVQAVCFFRSARPRLDNSGSRGRTGNLRSRYELAERGNRDVSGAREFCIAGHRRAGHHDMR